MDEESSLFIPNPWEPCENGSGIMSVPNPATQLAARCTYFVGKLQQGIGWIVLSHFGILLGSFAGEMSRRIFWFSWGIFMAEAGAKLVRSWLQSVFKDVPCCYVPLNNRYHRFAAALLLQLVASIVEIALYIPFILYVTQLWRKSQGCIGRLEEGLIAACVVIGLHLLIGILLIILVLNGIFHLQQKIEYLTWLLHLTRHSSLSVAAATVKSDSCGLPALWFGGVSSLLNTLSRALESSNSNQPEVMLISVSMKAVLTYCKQEENPSLRGASFDLLIKILTNGDPESRGVVAAIMGILASKQRGLDFGPAIRPLRWMLLNRNELEFEEEILGALLNISLAGESSTAELVKQSNSIVPILMEQATTLARTSQRQVLATSLLGRLLRKKATLQSVLAELDPFLIIIDSEDSMPDLQSAAAGLIWEMFYWIDNNQLNNLKQIIEILTGALQKGGELAANAAGGLASAAYKNAERKKVIVEANAIKSLVKMLDGEAKGQAQAQACRCLWILADHNKEYQGLITHEDAIPKVSKLLNEKEDALVIQQAAWLISRLAWNCKQNQDNFSSEGVIERLIWLLKERNEEIVLVRSVLALGEIAKQNVANQDLVFELNGIEVLFSKFDPTRPSKIDDFILNALLNISQGEIVKMQQRMKTAYYEKLHQVPNGSKLHNLVLRLLKRCPEPSSREPPSTSSNQM